MKITDLKTFIVGVPEGEWGGRYFTFVKLTTSNGIVGYGECYGASFGPKPMVHMIEDVFQRYVLGQSPFDIEKIWRRAYGSGYTQRPDLSMMGVLSGLEIAMWDIKGKALGQPVYNLMGGRVHEKLRSYTYIYPDPKKGQDSSIFWNAEASAQRAADYAAMGFTGIKFDPAAPYSAFDPRQPSLESIALCAKFCKLIREAVGTKADLLFGTHGQFTPSVPSALPRRLSPMTPCGLKSQHRPKSRKTWRWWRAAHPYP